MSARIEVMGQKSTVQTERESNAQGRADMQAAHKTTTLKTTPANANSSAGQRPLRSVANILTSIRAIIMLMVLAWAGNAWAGATTTTLASGANPSMAGQAVTLTATVTGATPYRHGNLL